MTAGAATTIYKAQGPDTDDMTASRMVYLRRETLKQMPWKKNHIEALLHWPCRMKLKMDLKISGYFFKYVCNHM